MSNLQRAFLLAILVYALLSRLTGIAWGLELFDRYVGDSRYHPDEFKIAVGAKNFPKDILSRTDLRYPTGLHYMVGILGFPVRAAAGTAVDDTQLYLLMGRLLSIAFGVAAVYLTYRLARQFAGVNAGLIAAALLAVSDYAVRESALATTDMAVSFWAVVVLLLTAKLTPESGWKAYLLLGIAAGFAIGTKYSGAFALIPFVVWMTVGILSPASGYTGHKPFSLLAIFFVSAALTFLLSTPSILVHPDAFLMSLRYESERLVQLRSPLWEPAVYLYFFTSLAEAANLFICISAAVVLVYIIIKRPAVQLVTYAVLVVCFYLYFNTALAARYWTLLLPPLCVLIGYSFERFNASANRPLAFFGMGLLTLCITAGIYQNYLLARLLLNDTRSSAAQFLEQLPENATFALGHNAPEADGWQYPFVPAPVTTGPTEIPDYIILSEFADEFPDHGILDVKIDDKNITYREITVFEPIEALKVEFLSPVIKIFQRSQ